MCRAEREGKHVDFANALAPSGPTGFESKDRVSRFFRFNEVASDFAPSVPIWLASSIRQLILLTSFDFASIFAPASLILLWFKNSFSRFGRHRLLDKNSISTLPIHCCSDKVV